MKKVVVMGGLGSGLIASSIIDELPDVELLGFLNDGYSIGTKLGDFKKVEVIGNSNDVHKFIKNDDVYVLLAYKTMKKEKEMWNNYLKMNIPRDKFINIIHPQTVIPYDYCSIGNGILMAANVHLSPDVTISDNCIVFGNTLIGHNTFLGKYVTVANNASIGADIVIGNASHIGSNCTIRQGVKIGDYSLIGMGSLILHDVPENTIAVGSPARIIKK